MLTAASASTASASALVLIVGVFISLVFYFIPSIVAMARRDQVGLAPVLVVNFLLGWTLIGWIVALVMALRSRPQLVMMPPPGWAPQQPPPGWVPPQQPPAGWVPPEQPGAQPSAGN